MLLLAALVSLPGTAHAQGLEGTWLTTGGKGIVEVKPCEGRTELLCGSIVWLKEPNDKSGRPLRDGYNPDPKLRRRLIMGLPIVLGLAPVAATQWQGQVYDPEKGKAFDVTFSQTSADRIELTGCGLMGLVCETRVWVRKDLPAEMRAAQ
jgi:uncharacterized protein (DUF2147 family)